MRPFEILLVEDNPGDVVLTREALVEAKVLHTLTVARDGLEAMEILRREPPFADAARPDLMLLDLNLPRMSGTEVLAAMRVDDLLRSIPVVMLTTSASERDVGDCYQLGVNCYITKPVDVTQFMAMIRSIENFWLSIVTLPPTPGSAGAGAVP